jgi:peptide/nickel transport system ATP-binding protein
VPYPDLDRPLDFGTAGIASAMASAGWAPAFRCEDGDDLAPADLGGGHVVLARRNADVRELVA